jgi:azurin
VFMLTIGKITGERRQYSHTNLIFVLTGNQREWSQVTQMGVNWSISVSLVMGGRNKNSILSSSKSNLVSMELDVKNLIAHISIMRMIENNNCLFGSNIFLRQEQYAFQITSTFLQWLKFKFYKSKLHFQEWQPKWSRVCYRSKDVKVHNNNKHSCSRDNRIR